MSTLQALPWESFTRAPLVQMKSGLTRRGLIYDYIRRHPGVHVRALAKGLTLATGDLQYHLTWLERNGYVKTKKSGFYRLVFPTMLFKEEQEVLLGVLSQGTPREILLSLLFDGPKTQGELARSLGHAQPTISWHMERLVQAGVVGRGETLRGAVYEFQADREDALRFVKTYYPGSWRRWATSRAKVMPAVVEVIGKR